jgi:excisionase family DNA binding protein
MTTIENETMYTIEEAAKILKLTTRTVYGDVYSGKIPAAKMGRQWRISETSLKNFMHGKTAAGKVEATLPRPEERHIAALYSLLSRIRKGRDKDEKEIAALQWAAKKLEQIYMQ